MYIFIFIDKIKGYIFLKKQLGIQMHKYMILYMFMLILSEFIQQNFKSSFI